MRGRRGQWSILILDLRKEVVERIGDLIKIEPEEDQEAEAMRLGISIQRSGNLACNGSNLKVFWGLGIVILRQESLFSNF